jgi:hypothetical protein
MTLSLVPKVLDSIDAILSICNQIFWDLELLLFNDILLGIVSNVPLLK